MNNSGITSGNNNGIAFTDLTDAKNTFDFTRSIYTPLTTAEAKQ